MMIYEFRSDAALRLPRPRADSRSTPSPCWHCCRRRESDVHSALLYFFIVHSIRYCRGRIFAD